MFKQNGKKSGLVLSLHVKQLTTNEQYELNGSCHNARIGHGGVQGALRNLKAKKKVWPGMKKAVKTFIKNCPRCLKMSAIKVPVNYYT